MKPAVLLLLAAIVGGMAYVRLAPAEPARWHVDPAPADDAQAWVQYPPGVARFTVEMGGARASVTLFGETPEEVLSRLDAIALASPRTRRLAGSPEEGRITWETRTAFFGFPDYTTAQARAEGQLTGLDVHARQRFGRSDFGVNAARLKTWLGPLSQ